MNGVLAGAIAGAALLAAIVVIAVLARRKRARRVPGREEILRRARAASGQIARDNRRTRRGAMKRNGLGEGTDPHRDSWAGDSSGSSW